MHYKQVLLELTVDMGTLLEKLKTLEHLFDILLPHLSISVVEMWLGQKCSTKQFKCSKF